MAIMGFKTSTAAVTECFTCFQKRKRHAHAQSTRPRRLRDGLLVLKLCGQRRQATGETRAEKICTSKTADVVDWATAASVYKPNAEGRGVKSLSLRILA